jgi:capping protein beta
MPMADSEQGSDASVLDCALDLMRRLPPQTLEDNLSTLIKLMPDHEEDLLSMIDQPLRVLECPKTRNEFLICDYNRYGDSLFRSPWSNEYVPLGSKQTLSDDAVFPKGALRKLEQELNDAFVVYRQMYYDNNGLSSAYLWELDDTKPENSASIEYPFAAAVLIKRSLDTRKDSQDDEIIAWDAIHILEISPTTAPKSMSPHANDLDEKKKKYWNYTLTTTILLYLKNQSNVKKAEIDHFDLSGNITRQAETVLHVIKDVDHIANIGRTVEDMENKMRSILQEIYFAKTKDVINELRTLQSDDGEALLPKKLAAMPIND